MLNKQDNSNLIDLATFNYDNSSNVKDSVLEAFDPLCTPKPKPTSLPIATSPDVPGSHSVINLYTYISLYIVSHNHSSLQSLQIYCQNAVLLFYYFLYIIVIE